MYIVNTDIGNNKKAQAIQKQIDKIIAENKDYVKQDTNKEAEVLTEAYELWLHTGVVADSEQQGLFEALKRFFQSVYSSTKDITGIRMNGEIDYLFRQMTGLAPTDMRGESSAGKAQEGGVMFQGQMALELMHIIAEKSEIWRICLDDLDRHHNPAPTLIGLNYEEFERQWEMRKN